MSYVWPIWKTINLVWQSLVRCTNAKFNRISSNCFARRVHGLVATYYYTLISCTLDRGGTEGEYWVPCFRPASDINACVSSSLWRSASYEYVSKATRLHEPTYDRAASNSQHNLPHALVPGKVLRLFMLIQTMALLASVLPVHVRWVNCHHGMARPQVADGGEGLQIWKVAANILNM